MKYKVTIKRKVLKTVETMPTRDQDRLALLIRDLVALGPIQAGWPTYSKLSTSE